MRHEQQLVANLYEAGRRKRGSSLVRGLTAGMREAQRLFRSCQAYAARHQCADGCRACFGDDICHLLTRLQGVTTSGYRAQAHITCMYSGHMATTVNHES